MIEVLGDHSPEDNIKAEAPVDRPDRKKTEEKARKDRLKVAKEIELTDENLVLTPFEKEIWEKVKTGSFKLDDRDFLDKLNSAQDQIKITDADIEDYERLYDKVDRIFIMIFNGRTVLKNVITCNEQELYFRKLKKS